MLVARKLRSLARPAVRALRGLLPGRPAAPFARAAATLPLMRDDKTYNPAHPRYNPDLVRNFPNALLGARVPCSNPVYLEIRRLAFAGSVSDRTWRRVLTAEMAEASAVPGFAQIMERKAYIEDYLAGLARAHGAHYSAGWVNLEDAHFLYWAVRRQKPKVIVQAGVSNGLSAAFMMLALAANGPDGRLYAVDLPHVFNPADPAWTQRGTVYGVAIPEGGTSGWMVPDIYRDRFHVQTGDAKALLPPLIDSLDSIDLFFHDSDHTYDHMMFEFDQAMRKLSPDGLIIADDIAWNSSLWDFAEARGVPGYNYRGSMGAAFFG